MTDLGRNLKKILDETDQGISKEELVAKILEYNRRIEESLHDVKGFGVISKDTALLEEVIKFAKQNDLYSEALEDIHRRTERWNSLGITNDSHNCEAILETVHVVSEVVYSYLYIVDRLAFLINHAEELNEFSRIGVPCNWHRCRNDVKASVEYWIGQGRLSVELVKRAANAVAGAGYDTGLEDWR